MPTEEEILNALSESVDDTPFVPLDGSLAADAECLAHVQRKRLRDRAIGGVLNVKPELKAADIEWRQALNEERIATYCGLLGTRFKGALLKSGQPRTAAAGYIRHLRDNPTFEIHAHEGSMLAEDTGTTDVIYRTNDLAHYLSLRTLEPVAWSELAWRSIAICLEEHHDSPFPGLTTRSLGGEVAVRLAVPAEP